MRVMLTLLDFHMQKYLKPHSSDSGIGKFGRLFCGGLGREIKIAEERERQGSYGAPDRLENMNALKDALQGVFTMMYDRTPRGKDGKKFDRDSCPTVPTDESVGTYSERTHHLPSLTTRSRRESVGRDPHLGDMQSAPIDIPKRRIDNHGRE